MPQFLLKAYGVEGWGATRWLQPAVRFIRVTRAVAIGLIIGWALTGAPHNGTRFALLVLWPVVLGILSIDLISNRCRLEDRHRSMALWQMAIPGSRLVVAIALLLVPQLTGRFVAVSYCLISLLVALWAAPQIRTMVRGDIALHGHGPRPPDPVVPVADPGTLSLWSQAWAYGAFAVLYPVFFQISTILLKYLHSDAQAGMYSIGLAIMTAIYLIPATIYQKFLLLKLHRVFLTEQQSSRVIRPLANRNCYCNFRGTITPVVAIPRLSLIEEHERRRYRSNTARLHQFHLVPVAFEQASLVLKPRLNCMNCQLVSPL